MTGHMLLALCGAVQHGAGPSCLHSVAPFGQSLRDVASQLMNARQVSKHAEIFWAAQTYSDAQQKAEAVALSW